MDAYPRIPIANKKHQHAPLYSWQYIGHYISKSSNQWYWGFRNMQQYRQFKESFFLFGIPATAYYFFIRALFSAWFHNWGISQWYEQAARDWGRGRKENQQWAILSSTSLPKDSSYNLEHEQHAAYVDYRNKTLYFPPQRFKKPTWYWFIQFRVVLMF